MIRFVSTNDTDFPRWIRAAALAINSLVSGFVSIGDNVTTLTGDVGTLTTEVGTLNTEVADLQAPTIVKFTPLASAPSSPGEGWTYYDSTLHKLRVWDGAAWQACW